MVFASAAGQEAVLPVVPVLPPAATTVTPRFTAYCIASVMAPLWIGDVSERLTTWAP